MALWFVRSKRKKQTNRHVGKIGYASSKTLGLPKGHYVYIRSCNNGKCSVNTLTSLERHNRKIKQDKIRHIKQGNIYAIPSSDTNLRLFSGIDKRVIKNVDINDIVDKDKHYIRSRHKHYINRFMK